MTPPVAPPPAPPPPDNGAVASSFQDLDISSVAAPISVSKSASTRFDAAAAAFEPSRQAASTAAAPDLVVQVANPQKVGEGMAAYFTYEVTTKTSLPQYAFGQFSVTRRFRDFDWLHAQLCLKFPGAIVPPLPEKHSTQVATYKVTAVSQSPAWLEERRNALQRFLHALVAHPFLHTAGDLQAFLEKPDDALEAWKDAAKQQKATTYATMMSDVKAGLFSSYNKTVSLVAGETSASFVPVPDVPCQQMGNYATALQAQVTAVHKHSKAYVDRNKALGQSMTGFGLALTQLATCEREVNESLSVGISHMGLCVGKLSATYAEQADAETRVFEEPMREYVRVLGAVKHAIGARDAALAAYNGAASSLQSKKERLDKLRAAGGKEDKIGVLSQETARAEESVAAAKAEYETVSARVDAEMARFQTEKLHDFKQYVTGFIKLQIEYSQRVQATWRELLPRLEDIDATPAAPLPVD